MKTRNYSENELSKIVFDAALKVHRTLGPGLLESAYQKCLFYELANGDLFVEKEKTLPLIYENIEIDCSYRLDIML